MQNLVFVRVSIVSDTELSIKKAHTFIQIFYSVLNLIVVVFSSEFVLLVYFVFIIFLIFFVWNYLDCVCNYFMHSVHFSCINTFW